MKKAIEKSVRSDVPEPMPDILGTVSQAQQNEILRTFDPQAAVAEFVEKIPERERRVLQGRYGLVGGQPLTLEEIGRQFHLTRERIRQIETAAIKMLRGLAAPANFNKISDLLFQFIEDRGNAVRQEHLISSLLGERDSPSAKQNVLFILHCGPQFTFQKESLKYYESWCLAGFDQDMLDEVVDRAIEILTKHEKIIGLADLCSELRRQTEREELATAREEVIESYLMLSRTIGRNPFGDFGLASWTQVKPRDVGDKAFLVLAHLGKPEHYSKITDLINKQGFGSRIAHSESVHNELIKDDRFVLVGRGIYGLEEWGYKPGVVADIISQVIKGAGKPLTREEIVSGVLKQRLVKRNTVIVGLSNKNKFRKTADNRYENV
ncbi:MAG: hypothetical protein A2846_03470 [Candidatus Doudnabacteria bacterium RIFCSPHIGHO2_01_FULL_49_9]|uniref:RNA polymerase sigma-70 domain-containing protein n=1 Tax=Candidatus Doudnabacteria bacterium RIFCSPHIGHO2_01_FULL_49_9 TaxID=1817827 RepID=A0A1F5NZW7_9BACT|nr:MAG: hypothetical protein A2846_03470 [Candidatus Doudnabacteria bacterium RIFCSPHIGHO2_01_FULL_49_9]